MIELSDQEMVVRAMRNYERHLKLPKGKANINLIRASVLGIEGYAKWKPPVKTEEDYYDENGHLKEDYENDEQDSEYWECKIDDKHKKKCHYDYTYWKAVIDRLELLSLHTNPV